MSRSVLVVTQCPNAQNWFLSQLTQAGYRVIQARDGIEGLSMIYAETPDLVLLDLSVPRLDGVSFIEGVRFEERFKTLPIFVLPHETENVKDEAKQAGATAFLEMEAEQPPIADAIERAAA